METVTLGLSFSTRMLGLAVFKSNTLLDYSVKLFKEKWSPEKRDLILVSLASCIGHYTVREIIVSIPEPHHQTVSYHVLLSTVESFALEHNIPTIKYPCTDVYKTLGSPVRRTRNSLMKRLIIFFPELSLFYDKELVNKNKYYIKLFEAVAVGAYHWFIQSKL